MVSFITFTASANANKAAYNDLHDRIMKLKGLPNSNTLDWARPLPHFSKSWCAMVVDETCYPAMTSEEIACLQSKDQLTAAGWFPAVEDVPKAPWWGFLVWWK